MTAHRGGLNHCSVPRSAAGRVSPVDRRRRRRPLPVPLVTAVIRGQVPLLLAGDYSRRVVGWQLSRSLRTDLAALDALETASGLAPTSATPSTGLVHHSDRGGHRAIRYTQRLAEAGALASVGSAGDSYDCETPACRPVA